MSLGLPSGFLPLFLALNVITVLNDHSSLDMLLNEKKSYN